MSTRKIGGIFQLGYVVDDLDRAIEHWTTKLRVGPFFVARHVKYATFDYQGQDHAPDVSLAFAYSGETNIELIQQHDDMPSVFLDFWRRRGAGLQHVGVLSDDLAADTNLLAAQGSNMILRLVNAANGVETRFFDTEYHPGAMLELIERSEAAEMGFAAMKSAAHDWDGSQPLIELD